jgi:hypothetical protein
MAMKPAKKTVAKKTVAKKTVSKPKPKVTKSRGSNTPKQIGDQNQREGYNSVRGQESGFSWIKPSKLSKAASKKNSGSMAEYKAQRAGGKGK